MKKLLPFLALVCMSISLTAQEWKVYKSLDLKFRAEFPSTPERTVQKVPSATGELDMHLVTANLSEDSTSANYLYSIIQSQYPKESFEDATVEFNDKILNSAVEGAVTNVKGDLLKEENILFNGFPGRAVKIGIQNNTISIFMNMYLVENMLYITQVLCGKENDGNSAMKRFFDSFDLIKTR